MDVKSEATKSPKEVMTYLRGCLDNLLQQKIDNHTRIGEVEDELHRLDGELKVLTRKDQSLGLSISQINGQIKHARSDDLGPRLIDELKKVTDRETYIRCVELARGDL